MPVRDLALDPVTGDLAVRHGDFQLAGSTPDMDAVVARAADQAAVAQGAGCRVKLQLGEDWLDETLGVPWVDQILIKNPNPAVVTELLRVAIAATPDVLVVTSAALVISPDRSAQVAYQMLTAYSQSPEIGRIIS